ncbi:hypothetical protein NC652_019673 [Populus alba x Populus x berolinensis]|nr:hypothetical protein NC652_019673 [Populus alba x Populus x berolinensis]
MADDTSVGSKRRITEIEEESLLQKQQQDHSCSFSSTFSPQGDSIISPTNAVQEEANHQDNPSPTSFKKVKSPCLTESDTSFREKQGIGFEENEVKCHFLNEKNVAFCGLVSGSSESGEFDEKIESSGAKVKETENSVDGGLKKGEIEWSVNDAKEVKEKRKDFVGSECFEAEMGLGTDDNKESAKAKESGGESLLEAKKKQLLEELEVGSILKNKTSVDNNVDDFDTNVGVSGSLKGFHESVRRSLKFELIDDTVLIEPVSETETANGGANAAERNGKKNGKQGTDGKKEKRPRRRGKVATKGLETSEGQKKVTQVGEAQNRTIHVGEIRDKCATDGDQMKRKYSRVEMEALRFANIVEQRKLWRDVYTGLGYDIVEGYKDLASSKHQKNVNLNFNPLEPFGRKEPGILGEESSENVDDGLEYLRRVSYHYISYFVFSLSQWEAAHIPKVKVAKLDRSGVNEEQTVYMPRIPDIAKCPEYLLPSRQWEDFFSQNDGPSTKISHEMQPAAIVHGSCSPQLSESIIVEKFNNLRASLISHAWRIVKIVEALLSIELLKLCRVMLYVTTLPVILAMDSVAQVSMLRRCIKLAETTDALSKNDTCASLRGLLRKCASLRAGKSELDEEVWLYDWWLAKVEGDGLAVSGFTFREGVGTRMFCSAAIVRRHYATVLETKDGITVTISGFINRDRTRQNGFSFQICEHFQLGFPYCWLELATRLGGEESANRGSPPGKSGFDEPKMSSGTSASAASVSFDDLPVTRIRDIAAHPLGDSMDSALADILDHFCSNDAKLSPLAISPDSKNPVAVANAVLDETPRKNKTADRKYIDGGIIPRRVDIATGEHITPSRGVVTRSMSRRRNFREIQEGSPSAFLSTSETTENLSGGMTSKSARKDSWATTSTEKIMEVPDVPLVRRSSRRPNIRKDYREM